MASRPDRPEVAPGAAAGTTTPPVPNDDVRREAPSVPGPMGEAPLTTESIGDPDAGDPTAAVEGGAATGAVLGTIVAGPIGLAAGAALGAAAGAAGAPGRTDEAADDARGRRPAPSAIERQRGVAAPGPLDAGEDIPVVDALTETQTATATRDEPRRRD